MSVCVCFFRRCRISGQKEMSRPMNNILIAHFFVVAGLLWYCSSRSTVATIHTHTMAHLGRVFRDKQKRLVRFDQTLRIHTRIGWFIAGCTVIVELNPNCVCVCVYPRVGHFNPSKRSSVRNNMRMPISIFRLHRLMACPLPFDGELLHKSRFFMDPLRSELWLWYAQVVSG